MTSTIRQFDVFATPLRRDRTERPFVVVVQSDWIATASRLCAALVAQQFLVPQGRLNPAFVIGRQHVYLHPIELVTLPIRILTNPVTNLDSYRDRIIAALDLVFLGI